MIKRGWLTQTSTTLKGCRLYLQYLLWCRKEKMTPLGYRRFKRDMDDLFQMIHPSTRLPRVIAKSGR